MVDSLVTAAMAGNQRSIARLATLIENRDPAGMAALELLHSHTGRAHVVAITGPPGAGKSSVINALIGQYLQLGKKVGVIAVDPSSKRTQGATLGDRVRMPEAYGNADVFVRSMASRGQGKGIALGTAGLIHLLDASGYDPILVETVGVGQDQIDGANLVQSVVLLQPPDSGDGIQMLKAGLLEFADILVVNKADLPNASRMRRDLRSAITESKNLGGSWDPAIVSTSAANNSGFEELREAIDGHRLMLEESGEQLARDRQRAALEIQLEAHELLEARLREVPAALKTELIEETADHRRSAQSAARELIDQTWPLPPDSQSERR